MNDNRSLRWGVYLIMAAGAMAIASGLSMLARFFTQAGYESGVDALGGVTSQQLAQTNPAMLSYITHLHVNVAGLSIALGLAVIALAWYGIKNGHRWAWTTAILLPAVYLTHSVPVHLTADFAYDATVHLGPIVIVVLTLAAGALLAHRGLQKHARRTPA